MQFTVQTLEFDMMVFLWATSLDCGVIQIYFLACLSSLSDKLLWTASREREKGTTE